MAKRGIAFWRSSGSGRDEGLERIDRRRNDQRQHHGDGYIRKSNASADVERWRCETTWVVPDAGA
jgi:hypothetical protein